MNRVIEIINDNAPYIGLVGGAVAGAVVDRFARNEVIENTEARVAAWNQAVEIDQPQEPSRLRRMAGRAGAMLVLSTSAAGMAGGMAWQVDAGPENKPVLSTVVDNSAITGQDPEVLQSIHSVARSFDTAEVKNRIIVSGMGEVRTVSREQLDEELPWGDTNLDEAMTVAASEISSLRSQTNGDVETAMVLVTNNHAPASNDAKITEAKQLDVPVVVANVLNKDGKDEGSTPELKKLAKETNGKYFEVNKDNVDDIHDEVLGRLEKAPSTTEAVQNWILRGLSTGLFFGVLFRGKKLRSQEPIGKLKVK